MDPIGRTEDRWSEAVGSGTRELSEHSHVAFGIHGRPLRTERRDTQGAPRSWRSYTYDGWGHCLSDTESAPGVPDKVTRYRYDDYDRTTEITSPDGSVVYRTYAAHSDDELVEATGVRHIPAGEAIGSGLSSSAGGGIRRPRQAHAVSQRLARNKVRLPDDPLWRTG